MYLLILILTYIDPDVEPVAFDFNSLEACEATKEKIEHKIPGIIALCQHKGYKPLER